MVREFILLALKAPTGSFEIDKMPENGRIDLVCRSISNALYVSNAIRKDTNIHVCLNGFPSELSPKIVSFFGNRLKGMEPDERTIGKVLLNTLEQGKNLKLGEEMEVRIKDESGKSNTGFIEGISVSKKAFETIVKEKAEQKNTKIFYLEEKGEDIRKIKFDFTGNSVFLLGDFIGLPRNTEKLLKRLDAFKIKLSPVMLFASHCPVLVHNEIDRQEYSLN